MSRQWYDKRNKYKEVKNSNIKRSGYVFALIDKYDINNLKGISIIQDEVYLIPRKNTEETIALLAISLPIYKLLLLGSQLDNNNIRNMLLSNINRENVLEYCSPMLKLNSPPGIHENTYMNTTIYISNDENPIDMAVTLHHINISRCSYLEKLRTNENLKYIIDLNKLYVKYSRKILEHIDYMLMNKWEDQYVLLNIEPRGYGKYEKIYPGPLITLPGGTMENIDNNDFEDCAFREFCEETSIDIKKSGYIFINQENFAYQKPCLSFSNNKLSSKPIFYIQQISWFFCIHLIHPDIMCLNKLF
jgi:hypothetical protein